MWGFGQSCLTESPHLLFAGPDSVTGEVTD
jgi:hypothetical protein